MVAVELEVMAKKMDRFGWDRDRGSMAHDRMIQDWMDALHDFPLDEVKNACRAWVDENPRRMPNEGDIKKLILRSRHDAVLAHKARQPKKSEPVRERVSPERAAQIAAAAGFNWGGPKRFPATGEGAQ